MEAALRELPEMERAVLVLYHQEECSYEGIAAALGLPINTVRTHLHRGRKRLSEVLRGRGLRGRREASGGSAEGSTGKVIDIASRAERVVGVEGERMEKSGGVRSIAVGRL